MDATSGLIILRSSIKAAVHSIQQHEIVDDDRPLLNELMQKEKISEGELIFIMRVLRDNAEECHK